LFISLPTLFKIGYVGILPLIYWILIIGQPDVMSQKHYAEILAKYEKLVITPKSYDDVPRTRGFLKAAGYKANTIDGVSYDNPYGDDFVRWTSITGPDVHASDDEWCPST